MIGVSMCEGLNLKMVNDFLAQWWFNICVNPKELKSTVECWYDGEYDPNVFLAMLLPRQWLASGWEFQGTSRRHANIRNSCKNMHGAKRANFFSCAVIHICFLFVHCFANCSQYLDSIFSQQITLSSSSGKQRWSGVNYFKLLATSAFLEPKKLLLSFHGLFYSLIFSYLLITPKSVSPAPSSLSSLDSDMHLTTGHMHRDGHRHLILMSSSLTCFSSKIPHLTGTTIPSSIQGRNLVVNLDFSLSFTPHSRVLMLIFQVLFYFLNIYQIHPLLRSPAKLPSCRLL